MGSNDDFFLNVSFKTLRKATTGRENDLPIVDGCGLYC